MNLLKFIFLFFFCTISAQKVLPFDTLKLRDVQDFFVDDYRNIYLYKNKDFSFTKYDSIGNQMGKMMMTVPFKVQGVQNPLTIFLFSENAQELKMMDGNLNEIQRVDFRQKFGFVKMAYAEDLQQIWILDESSKRLLQYNFRQDFIINSYPFYFDFMGVKDILVYENLFFVLTEDKFWVYNFKGEKKYEAEIKEGRKLRRENNIILAISQHSVSKFENGKLETAFEREDSEIVDKNTHSYFEWKDDKFYLYPVKVNAN